MPPSKRQDGRQFFANGRIAVPAGAPSWITAQLLEATIDTWQPHYDTRLTPEDALEILLNVDRLLGFLDGSGDEKGFKEIPRVGPRLQP
jgi:hypothetical protein